MIFNARNLLQVDVMFAGLFTLGLFGFLFIYAIIGWIEQANAGPLGRAVETVGAMTAKIRIVNLRKTFKLPDESAEVEAIRHVTLDIHAGQFVILFGPQWMRQIHPAEHHCRIRDADRR
jgi:hypothetical protein